MDTFNYMYIEKSLVHMTRTIFIGSSKMGVGGYSGHFSNAFRMFTILWDLSKLDYL